MIYSVGRTLPFIREKRFKMTANNFLKKSNQNFNIFLELYLIVYLSVNVRQKNINFLLFKAKYFYRKVKLKIEHHLLVQLIYPSQVSLFCQPTRDVNQSSTKFMVKYICIYRIQYTYTRT